MKTYYVCEICKEQFENEEDAIDCESKGIKDSKFKIGHNVLIKNYDGELETRTIVNVVNYKHEKGFKLNDFVYMRGDYIIGIIPIDHGDGSLDRPALESDFYDLTNTRGYLKTDYK